MRISRHELIKKIHKVWPDLVDSSPGATQLIMYESDYWMISRSDLEWILSDTWFDKYRWVLGGFDCSEMAILFHAFTIQERYKNMMESGKTNWLPWALGHCAAFRLKGEQCRHALNICIARNAGVLLFDARAKGIWQADRLKDDVHMIEI